MIHRDELPGVPGPAQGPLALQESGQLGHQIPAPRNDRLRRVPFDDAAQLHQLGDLPPRQRYDPRPALGDQSYEVLGGGEQQQRLPRMRGMQKSPGPN